MNASPPLSQLQAGAQAFLARYDSQAARPPQAAAAALFARNGLPGPREEDWRYSLLRPVTDVHFTNAPHSARDVSAALLRLPKIDAPRLIFVDGRFRADLSDKVEGVTAGAPAYGSSNRPDLQKLVALNTMLAEDGIAITVPAGHDGGTLVLVSIGTGDDVSFHPNHAVTLGDNARLTLLEFALGDGVYLNNPVLSATVGKHATLTHLRLQQEALGAFHLSTVYADVAGNGTYDSFALTLGARLARMEVHANLNGPQASAHLNAAQLLGGHQHADFTTVIHHAAPNTASRQTVKNVLTGHSRGVFQGKIEVDRIAQKTDGYQMNQALLLSPDAEMDCKPQLEIYADDVKCSHGATIGELDGEQLFYLRSRGIKEAEARAMLVRAFLSEALDPISHEAGHDAMEAAIAQWWERHTV
jgi:Fe-S cluster assembly protein SufD